LAYKPDEETIRLAGLLLETAAVAAADPTLMAQFITGRTIEPAVQEDLTLYDADAQVRDTNAAIAAANRQQQ
jgi:hypothetical protein